MQAPVENALQKPTPPADSGNGRWIGSRLALPLTRSCTDPSWMDSSSVPTWTRTAFRE
jgi:hypothetical protein